jgi:adenine specific DNA methylase Mod
VQWENWRKKKKKKHWDEFMKNNLFLDISFLDEY